MELKKYNANHTQVLKINQIVRTISETHKFDKDKLIAINTSDVENGVMGNGTLTFVDELKGQFKKTIVKDDILFSEIRPANRRFAKVTTKNTKDYVVSTKLMVLRKYNEDVDLEYFYYCLTNQPFLDILQRRAENRIGSFPQITFDLLSEYAFPIPPISEQKRISSVISTLDKKIALNRQINQNLEAMAKQLYDYWFVQFDFPNENGRPYKSFGGKMVWNEKQRKYIPEYWEVKSLSNWLEIKSGFPFKSETYKPIGRYKIITIKNVQDGELVTSGCDYVNDIPSRAKDYISLQIGDRLISLTGNCGRLCVVCEENLLLNQRVGLLCCDAIYLEYFYNFLNSGTMRTVIDNLANGAAQANLSPVELCKTDCFIPPIDILLSYNRKVNAIRKAIVQNNQEISQLAKQRDELLPLLMNGQVSVNSDLAASYIIYKNKIIRIMKENIIQAIVAEMQRDLDCRQMARLKAVLTSELHNVEIIEKSDCATQQTQENEHLLNSFISAKKIEGCSDKTLTYYRNTIERLLVTLSLAICHITTTDIRTYLSDYQEEHQSSKVTIDNMRRIFSSFFAWLEDEDYIAKSPVRRIHKVKTDSLVKEVLSDEQLEQLRDSCTNKRDLAIIDILASTGIRVGELVKLNREDIDFHERQCVVFGKGNKERIVYFNARTKLHLQQYLNERTDDNPALFVSLHSPHTRLTISGVEIRIRKLGQSLSMPKVHPHKFRRTLATMAIDKGMPIEQVQRLLGHVRIDTTLHYAIVNQNNVKLAHKKYLG